MSEAIDIRSLRDRLGWTQERLAQELGLDRSSVSRMETGQSPKGPTAKLLKMIAEIPPGRDERTADESRS
jgi:transcriptional regulator with XRE-family HTH domain